MLHYVSVRGRQRAFPAVRVTPAAVAVVRGGLLKVAEIHDEFLLQSADTPEPETTIEALRHSSCRPDIFTFAQNLPDVVPRYPYHLEWDNLAVLRFESYAEWFEKKIRASVRNQIRQSLRRGVRTQIVPFSDNLVEGICSIYNESSLRQGRKFWHYGKPFNVVKEENATYPDRSVFLGAYVRDELIGFIRIVFNEQTAHLIQIISKIADFDRRPNNALIAKAIEVCDSRGVKFLCYSQFSYKQKTQGGVVHFKRENGFEKVDIPRFYVPLTTKGRFALVLRLENGVDRWIPASIRSSGSALRESWYRLWQRRHVKTQRATE